MNIKKYSTGLKVAALTAVLTLSLPCQLNKYDTGLEEKNRTAYEIKNRTPEYYPGTDKRIPKDMNILRPSRKD